MYASQVSQPTFVVGEPDKVSAYLDWATPVLPWTPWSCAPLRRDTPCSRVSSIARFHLLKNIHGVFHCTKSQEAYHFSELSGLIPDLVEPQTLAPVSHISTSTFIIRPLSNCPPSQTLKVFSDLVCNFVLHFKFDILPQNRPPFCQFTWGSETIMRWLNKKRWIAFSYRGRRQL